MIRETDTLTLVDYEAADGELHHYELDENGNAVYAGLSLFKNGVEFLRLRPKAPSRVPDNQCCPSTPAAAGAPLKQDT